MGRNREFAVEETLDKALQVFWDKGYEAASMNDLVDAMGIQRASLYHAFGSKAELYVEALIAYQERGYGKLLRLLESEGTAMEKFQRLLETAIPAPASRGCFCVDAAIELAPHEEGIAALLRAHFDRVTNVIARIAAAGQADGSISTEWSPRDIGSTMLSVLNGLHVTAKTHPEEGALRTQITLALQALKP